MKIDRLVSIIVILLDQKRVSAQKLAGLLEVSTRTIYRDIDAINMAGIPVRAVSGVGGGFEIMPEYKLDKKVFSASDLSTILRGLSCLSDIVRGDELANALAKIRSLIPAGRAEDIEIKTNQICIDPSPWPGHGNDQLYLQTVRAALEEHKLISFAYTAHHGKKTVRTVEPYQLIWKSRHWYFYGYCHNRNDCRLFRLSRMSDLQIEQESFVPRDYQKPVLGDDGSIEAMQTEIKIRIHRSVLDRVFEFCTCDSLVPDGDEHYLVNFPFIENDYYYDILLGFADQCECLGPPHIRAELTRKIHRMAAIYSHSSADSITEFGGNINR